LAIYRVLLRPRARKAWDRLDEAIRRQLIRKLDERRRNPHVPAACLSGLPGCYKIKLRSAGIRLVYQVRDRELVILVLAIGQRDKNEVYAAALAELQA
jgi:mRNA interferase RelE/StbE